MSISKCAPWRIGKFQLIGDAAHNQTPFGALGLNGSL